MSPNSNDSFDDELQESQVALKRFHKRTSSAEIGKMMRCDPERQVIWVVNFPAGNLIPLDIADLDDIQPIGKGAQAKIFAAMIEFFNDSGEKEFKPCVLKEMGVIKKHAPDSVEKIVTDGDETSTDHRILKLIGYVNHEGETYAIFPYCELFLDKIATTLPQLVSTNPIVHQIIVLEIMLDLLNAIQALHLKGYIHRDIKLENLAYYHGKWCLNDLGVSVGMGQHCAFKGTLGYAHPHSFVNSHYTAQPENDIYALGQVFKILLGHTPHIINALQSEHLLNPKATVAAQQKYIAMQAAAYEAALDKANKKAQAYIRLGLVQPTLFTLAAIIGQYDEKSEMCAHNKVEQKLLRIAQRMTCLLSGQQANIVELIDCCEKLKVELEATPNFSIFQKKAEEFYTSHSNHGPFPLPGSLTARRESESSAFASECNLSLSDVSFFSKRSSDAGFRKSSDDLTLADFEEHFALPLPSLLTKYAN